MTARAVEAELRGPEAGFTLLELVISITITGLILVTMGFAITESLRNSATTSASIDRSIVGNFAARYFGADVASATYGSSSVVTSNPPACGSGNAVIDIQTGAATAVSYALVAVAGQTSLMRSTCSGTVDTTLTQTGRTTVGTSAGMSASAGCPTTTSCQLVLSWSNPTYSLSISGTRWVNATTTTSTP